MLSTTEKISAIREECARVNPEIMELKFGCVVRCLDYVGMEDDRRYAGVLWDIDCDGYVPKVIDAKQQLFTMDLKHQILGRPIHLSDIILMFAKRGYNSTEEWHKLLGKLVDKWKLLRADDLTLQEPATIDFIHQILFK